LTCWGVDLGFCGWRVRVYCLRQAVGVGDVEEFEGPPL